MVAALAACASNRQASAPRGAAPPSSPDARADATPKDVEAYAEIGYRLVWRGFPVMSNRARPEFFVVSDQGVLVHNTRNVITFMEISSGANRWSTQVGQLLSRFFEPVQGFDRVLSSSDNELFVLDASTGALLERQRLARVVNTPPLVQGEFAIFGATNGRVLGHNLSTGLRQWEYGLNGAIDARPVAVGSLAGVVSQRGDVVILDPINGRATLRSRVFDGLENNPVGDEDGLYVASMDQSVYAFPSRGASALWRHRTEHPLSGQPVIDDGVLYVTLVERGLTAFDAGVGEPLWNAAEVSGRVIGFRDDRLLVWNAVAQTITALDPDRGDVITSVTLNGVMDVAMDDFVEGDLYLMSTAGVVSRLEPR